MKYYVVRQWEYSERGEETQPVGSSDVGVEPQQRERHVIGVVNTVSKDGLSTW